MALSMERQTLFGVPRLKRRVSPNGKTEVQGPLSCGEHHPPDPLPLGGRTLGVFEEEGDGAAEKRCHALSELYIGPVVPENSPSSPMSKVVC